MNGHSSFRTKKMFFDVFSTVHHSIGLFLQPTLMHNSITACMSHYYPLHVSGLDMPILRRNNCTNTASGILALISGCTLHRLWERGYQMLCLCSCSSWGWACQGPKHVEDKCDIHAVIELCIKVGWRNNPIKKMCYNRNPNALLPNCSVVKWKLEHWTW